MFSFKKTFQKAIKAIEPKRDVYEVIAEIHESFDTASEKLLKEAKEILAGSYDTEKGERLKAIGFVSAKKVVEAEKAISDKRKNKELASLIEYYQMYYPNNKFITEEKTKEICQKYGLLCADTKYYISDVPEKNLSEIEAFKLRDDDMEKINYNWYEIERTPNYSDYVPCYNKKDGAIWGFKIYRRTPFFGMELYFEHRSETETHEFRKENLKICASVKDFDTNNMRIEDGYKLEQNLPDPIVLQPVKGGYLVVSKWGLEGQDADLINEKSN